MSINNLLNILDKSEQVKKPNAVRDIRKENFNNDNLLKSIRNLFNLEKDKDINDNIERYKKPLWFKK